ncbi:putative MFS sugar transporter [Aspergillus flavus]|uniref:MFS sugar transporter n=1 Tax=Aspergillus flavus (strain ATCC 200026 / FGSC A1120 / IAM 13836 / NRRL 3357 / JCM 12722 / SRRC 167) TaxID=332952 RepID=A0A7U2MYQ1_ASPFN|nr:putative MFS sugar transporter [Aspergillus flavus]
MGPEKCAVSRDSISNMTVLTREKKPYFGLTGGWLTFWVTVACATDMSLFGYDQGVFSGVVITRDFLEVHDLVGPEKTKTLSTVTAIYDVGCFFGAIVAFTIGEQLGRKKAILLGTTIMAIGAVLQAASFSLAQMFVGRIILGIGNGINTATAPIWQTETSQLKWRGKLVIFEMMMNIFGFCLVNWINYGLSFVGGSIAWRFPLAFQFFFLIILWSTTPWLPESPRWLIAHGRQEEATVVLSCLEAKPIDDPFVIAQRNEIEFSVRYERENSMRWRDLCQKKGNDSKTLRRLLLGAGSQFMQQFGGINIMSYYLPTVLMDSVGLSDTMARLLAACNALSYLVFSGLAVLLVERMGRRGLMLLSTFGQFLCFLIITILLRFSRISDNGEKFASASVAFFFLYYGAFGIGMLGVPWLYPTEINSLPMRTKGAAVATATDWITNFVVVEITPIGIKNIDWKFWIVWTVTNAAFLPILYFLYPETANRSLEDMDEYYRSNPALIVTKDPDAICRRRPQKYLQREEEEIERAAAAVDKRALSNGAVEHAEWTSAMRNKS